jgi:hypothetical protein
MAASLPALSGEVYTEVGIIIRESNGRLLSAGLVEYRRLGYVVAEQLTITHAFSNITGGFIASLRMTPYNDSVESTADPAPPNCYSAILTGAASDHFSRSDSNEICFYGPAPPGGGGGTLPTTCHNCGSSTPEPLILDLNGDGIHTTSLETSPVRFDLTGEGLLDTTAWTDPDTEEGILYFDLNRNGVIDGGAELFGDATLLPDGTRAQHGFIALAAYDLASNGGNQDGVISPADGIWGRIRVWVDRSHDGRMSRDESHALAEAGILELSLNYVSVSAAQGEDAAGNFQLQQGFFSQRVNGRIHVRVARDLYFRAIVAR